MVARARIHLNALAPPPLAIYWQKYQKNSVLLKLVLITSAVLLQMTLCHVQSVQAAEELQSPHEAGDKQVKLLLQDRPQLQTIVQKGNTIWNWLQAAFGDTSQGIQIHWDNRQTSAFSPQDAESTAYADDSKISYVKVDGTFKAGPNIGLQRSPEEILSELVFELNNVRYSSENRKVTELAQSGRINRNDYIRAFAKVEYLASQKRVEFYNTIWVPFCQKNKLPLKPQLWGVQPADTFEEWLSGYPRNFWYPWQYYGERYDWLVAQRNGDLKFQCGDFEGAIADYTLALKLGSRSYYWRGIAEMIRGNQDRSLADMQSIGQLVPCNASTKDFSYIFSWLILVKKDQRTYADQQLTEYFGQRLAGSRVDWPSRIALFLLNRSSKDDLLADAVFSESKLDPGQQCEAWYYIGIKALQAGEKGAALASFRKCLSKGDSSVAEYSLAREEIMNDFKDAK